MHTRRAMTTMIARGLGGLAAVAVFGRASTAHAASVTVAASLSTDETIAGQGVYLTVEVTEQHSGHRPLVSRPIIGVDDGSGSDPGSLRFQLTKTGSRSSFSFRNGASQSEVTTSYTYTVMPDREGDFVLDVAVEADDARIEAPGKLQLSVAKGALPSAPEDATPGAAAMAERPQVAGRPKVFLRQVTDQTEAWINQPVLYRYEIWERVDGRLEPVELPTFKDFFVEDLPTGASQTRMTADGTRYRVHTLLHRVLYPARAGKIEIGAAEVKVTPQVGFGLFSRPSARPPFKVKGKPLTLEVKALPAEGQPAGFSANNVGRFEVSGSVDRKVVETGDALTWKVEVSGEGNVRAVDPGDWPELEGFRAYEPKEHFEAERVGKRVGGRKRFEMLLVAQTPGAYQLPAFEFHYFDPVEGQYATARTEPISLEVRGEPVEASPEAATGNAEGALGEDEDLLADLFTPATLPRSGPRRDGWLTRRRWRRLTLAAPLALGAGWAGLALWRRFGPDEGSRARARRAAWARERLDAARKGVADGEGFHGAIADLLQDAAVRRVGDAGVGRTREALAAALEASGVSASEVRRWRELLDRCDAARFGGDRGDAKGREMLFDRASELIHAAAWRAS